MAKGKRYQTEGKLNYTKVFAVIIAIAVVIMFIFIIRNVFKQREKVTKNYQYFTLYAQNKWGVMNQDGEEVITPSYQEMIIIPDEEKEVFICTYDVDDQTGTYKTKAINSKNEDIFTEYDQVEAIDNMDKNNNLWYEKNVLKVSKNGKYGLIDFNGKELLPIEYDEITTLDGMENSIIIKKDEKVGLVNDNGSIIIDVNYKEIKALGETYKEGYITIDESDKYGVVSATKRQILENKYDEISSVYLKDYYLVKENGKKELIDSDEHIKELHREIEKINKQLKQEERIEFSEYTMIGALAQYISTPNEKFQPMNANYGILPELEGKKISDKKLKYGKLSDRALEKLNLQNIAKI